MILFIEVNVLLKIDFGVMVLWKYINFKEILIGLFIIFIGLIFLFILEMVINLLINVIKIKYYIYIFWCIYLLFFDIIW